MNMLFLGVLALLAYSIQIFLGMRQLKHFNQTYIQMKRKGRVAIGRRPGKLVAGTILLLRVDDAGDIQEAQLMQGISVVARFKPKPRFIGRNIHDLSETHPMLSTENKLTRQAAMSARDVYVQVEKGDYKDEKLLSPMMGFGVKITMIKQAIQEKFHKRSA